MKKGRQCFLYIILIYSAFISKHFLKSLYADDDFPALFSEIIEANTKINTVEADITQYISTPEHAKEIFKGRYFADNKGRFRIEYTSPSKQIVVNNGADLFWFYPDDNTVYTVKQTADTENRSGINPLKEFNKTKSGENYSINYLGKHLYGFFTLAYHYRIKDSKNNLLFNIWVNVKTKVLLAKIITNNDGIEITKELYSDYEKIKNVYFPKRIDVYARTDTGINKNTTKYSGIKLNFTIPESTFKLHLPENVVKKYLN
ncbi:MAG: DUF4292 domain-containing protein [Spirochaetes bacterium]|nr:DUF4292 domain-containing protein [Spirochaetota bacterium]